jgi:thiamine-phosphate pyrophosphorylase
VTLRLPPIYAITDRAASGLDHPQLAARLFAVGIRLLQVREKDSSDRDLLAAVEQVGGAARACGARVIVNDRPDVALLAGVGVHLGHEDLPAGEARRLLGPSAAIGVSTHDLAAARAAFDEGIADYVAFGPVFESGTKTVRPARGVEELARVAAVKTRPLVAIGGIAEETVGPVLDAGADSAAVIGALYAAGRVEENARRLLDRARRRSPPGRVYLVGFMGAGKTAVGRRVAQRLGVPFVDLDEEIERTSGITVRALFEKSGESAFRRREALFLEATSALSDAVVATGGGCYTFDQNRRAIARLGRGVYLDVPLAVLLSRLEGKTDRPLFQGPAQAAQLFAEREPFYRMAPVHVPLVGTSVEESADRVLSAVYRPVEITAPPA